MPIGELRAWLLNIHTHGNVELLRVFRDLYYRKVQGTTPGENKKIEQVLKVYNVVDCADFGERVPYLPDV